MDTAIDIYIYICIYNCIYICIVYSWLYHYRQWFISLRPSMAVVYPSSRHSHGLPKPASATACQVGSTLIWPQRKLVACLLGQVGAPGPGIGSFYGCWFWDEDDLFCQHRMVSWRYSQMYSGWWLNQPISQIKTGSFGIIIPVAVRWKWKPPASFSLYSQNRLLAMQKKDEVPVSD